MNHEAGDERRRRVAEARAGSPDQYEPGHEHEHDAGDDERPHARQYRCDTPLEEHLAGQRLG